MTTPRSGSTGSSSGTAMPLRSSSKPKTRSLALVGCSSFSLIGSVSSSGSSVRTCTVRGCSRTGTCTVSRPAWNWAVMRSASAPAGSADDALERAVVDLELQRLGARADGDGGPVPGDAQPPVLDRHLEVGLVDAGQLGDDGDAVGDAVDVDARPPGLLQAVAGRRREAEDAVEEVVDALAEALEVLIPLERAPRHGAKVIHAPRPNKLRPGQLFIPCSRCAIPQTRRSAGWVARIRSG